MLVDAAVLQVVWLMTTSRLSRSALTVSCVFASKAQAMSSFDDCCRSLVCWQRRIAEHSLGDWRVLTHRWTRWLAARWSLSRMLARASALVRLAVNITALSLAEDGLSKGLWIASVQGVSLWQEQRQKCVATTPICSRSHATMQCVWSVALFRWRALPASGTSCHTASEQRAPSVTQH